MINFNGTDKQIHTELELAGYRVLQKNNVHEAYDLNGAQSATIDTNAQAVIDAYDPILQVKKDKIKELKAEGLNRVQVTFPAIKDFDDLDLVREQYLSVKPASRSATVDFQTMIDTVQAGKAAAADIKALTLEGDINAYDVVNTPAWP